MPTTLTITRNSQILTDNDNDGRADSGDVIRTILRLTNVGVENATNLSVSDNFTGSTFVASSLKITPIAFDDAYGGISGNTPITYGAGQGMLVNDVDPDGAGGNAGLTVTGVDLTGTAGTVAFAADGSFTFTPTTGFTGTTSFKYFVSDAQGLSNVTEGIVQLTVVDKVWYVDNTYAGENGASDGSYMKPFTQLTQLNGVTGDGTTGDDVDGTGDTIFVYHNGANYTSNITLEAGQKLYGDGNALLVNGHNIGGTERTGGVDNVATNSVLNVANLTVGITVASDNDVKGFDLVGQGVNSLGIADNGGAISTGVNQLTISNVGLSGQGSLIDLDSGGKAVMSFTGLSSTTSGASLGGVVDLTGLTSGSSLAVSGATSITGAHSQAGIDISGNAGITVTFTGNVTVNTSTNGNNALVIDNNTGTNTVAFNGTANTFNSGAGHAVEMTGNTTSTTVSFPNGGLNIDTTSGDGLNVGATTINIAGALNTIDTTTGQIFQASSAAVGAGNLAFASLTATGTVAGPAIDINALTGGTMTVNGVTIADTSAGSDALNIRGGSTTNFTFNGITDINGTGSGGDGVELNGANGTVSFNNLTIDGVEGTGNGMIINGATNSVTVTAGSIGTSTNTGDAFNVTGGSGQITMSASISKNTAGNAVDVSGHSTGTINFNGNVSGTGSSNGISLTQNASGNINFNGDVTLNTGTNNAFTFTNTLATGANVSLINGSLEIDTTTGTGINATSTVANVGSLTITGASNSVAATTGRAINIDNVTADLTFLDVSKNGGSTTGVFMRNTNGAGGTSGQFVITGTGSTAGSGGTFNAIDDAGTNGNGATANQTGTGIYLENVSNVSLSNLIMSGGLANFGIHGERVNNFTLRDSAFNGTFGDTGATGPDEAVIRFGTQFAANNGLIGSGVFQGNVIQGGAKDNVAIFNGADGALNLSFADSASDQAVFNAHQAGGNIGIHVETGGTNGGGQGSGFDLTMSVVGLSFTGSRADAIFVQALEDTTQNITIQNNVFTNNQADKLGGFVNVNGSGAVGTNYVVDFNISGNTMTGAVTSPIVAVYNGENGDISGIIHDNTIGTSGGGTDSSGSTQGNGIFAAVDRSTNTAGTLNYAVRISNNDIHDLFQASGGIAIRSNNASGGGTARLEATVTNNIVNELGTQALSALFLQLGGGGGADDAILGINLTGNTFVATANQLAVVDIDQISASARLNVPSYGGATSGAAAANGLNSFWTTTNGNSFTQGGAAFSTYGANLVGVTNTPFTLPVPLMAVMHEILAWEDDPSIVITHPHPGDEPSVTVGPADPGSDGSAGGSGGEGDTPAADTDPTPDAEVVYDAGLLSQAQLDNIVEAAIQRWAEAGLSEAQLEAMRAVTVAVQDMSGFFVGASTAGQIRLDSDGAGYGWFIDATPGEDSEYEGEGSRLTADPGTLAASRIDLLTVVMHELGHQIGLDDSYSAGDYSELMYGYLNPGERRLPEQGDAAGAIPGSLGGTAYAIGPITNITVLPPGKAVDIYFDTMVNTFSNQVIPVFTNQATASGTNLVASPVTSNSENLIVDSLTLGDLVFLDVNGNGLFDGGDSVISGVTVTLYADANGNGALDGAELTTVLATDTTDGSGLYLFEGLAPGDYVVSIDASNFSGAGVLNGYVIAAGGSDPDNNTNNDSNGVAGPGGTVISAPIRLDHNQETVDDGTGQLDINDTLDFGFLQPNQLPVFTGLDGTPSFTEGGAAVVLDNNATVSDPNLTATNYNGASLTLARSGGANASDVFGTSGTLSFTATDVLVGATTVGTYTQSGGTLAITFNTNATQALVDSTLQQLTYSNSSQNPPATAAIAYAFSDGNTGAQGSGGAGIANGSVTVSITADDDPAVAVDDPGNSTPENASVIIAVLTNDSDPDGPPPSVAQVNGMAISVGSPVVLPSGAVVSLNGDGTLTYDPNNQFNTLTSTASGQTGAVNTSAPDSFTYTLAGAGAGTATVSITVNGVVSPEDHLEGDTGNNNITGTPLGDYFDLSQGGDDIAMGLGSNDGFFFGAEFTGADQVDGGGGLNDQIGLFGDYTGANALIMGANTIANIEAIVALPGFSYDITMHDGNVAPGGLLKVQSTQIGPGNSFTFNGSAELDGSFIVYGGQGTDNITGGSGNDGFYFGPGAFGSGDFVDGGPGGNDQLALDGNYGGFGPAYELTGGNIINVEVGVLLPGPSGSPNTFNLTTNDTLVAAGQTMTIFGLQVTTNIVFNGSNELDGAFRFFGGSGSDSFTGSTGADWIFGGGGGDQLSGGAGADNFYYDDVSQSASVGFDKIFGFNDNADTIDLPFAVTGFAAPAAGNLSNATFDADLSAAFAGLTANQAGMFTATGGDMSGRSFLIVEANGNTGYQAGSDYVIEIVSPASPIDNPAIFV